MLRALFGLDPADSGSVTVGGQRSVPARNLSPAHALEAGLDLLSEDRKAEGLALEQSVLWNLTLSAVGRYSSFGLIDRTREAKAGEKWAEALGIRFRDPGQAASTLSGGNQQKLCLARLLHHDSEVFLLDEPTRGIDIASKADVYRLVKDLASAGKTVVVVSSYLPELLGICHRLAVMHRGRLSALLPVDGWTEHSVMYYATTGRFEEHRDEP
jgi:ribose transport system ATP-binding protein